MLPFLQTPQEAFVSHPWLSQPNVAGDRRSCQEVDAMSSKTHQMTMELIRVLDLWWRGDRTQFDQFSRTYLTSKGTALARAIEIGTEGDELYRLAKEAVTAGY